MRGCIGNLLEMLSGERMAHATQPTELRVEQQNQEKLFSFYQIDCFIMVYVCMRSVAVRGQDWWWP
jgi:hypothetical protein